MDQLVDLFGRTIGDVRISVTDRCNFRCGYCIPEDYSEWMPRDQLLSFEEITRLVGVLRSFGVRTVRLTGGEPLMRKQLHKLIAMLRDLDDELDLSLTTNGFFLAGQAAGLAAAGLARINVSLDSLRPERFAELTRRDALSDVLAGIAAAKDAGLSPVKINTVAMQGVNDDEIGDLAGWGRDEGCELRFIEFMPLDGQRSWSRDQVFGKRQILEIISKRFAFEPVATDGHEPATRYRYTDGHGCFGIIASVTEPFCQRCDRIRITADGMLRTCLFALDEHNLRDLLRSGASDVEIAELFRSAVLVKQSGHKIGSRDFVQPGRAMVAIGG